MTHFFPTKMLRFQAGKAILNLCLGSGGVRHTSTRTTVMSFGDGSHGALGLQSSMKGIGIGGEDAYEPSKILKLPPDVSSVSAGHYHSLAVTSQGQLWAWGRNHEAQLGRGPSSCSRDSWNEPKRVQGLDRVTVCSSSASGVISAAIGDDGSLWVWGKSKRGQLGLGKNVTESVMPTRVESLVGEKISQVSFGWGHALARTEDGKLYGWGYSADGRLGKSDPALEVSFLESSQKNRSPDETRLSDSAQELAEKLVSQGIEKEKVMPIIWEPLQLKELCGFEVVDISCGLDHSLVLCRNGTLLSGGSNIYGQLGRVKEDVGFFPVALCFPPVSIASGLGHSLSICRDESTDVCGSIFTWGWNASSQLGRSGCGNVPMEVEGLSCESVVCVSGGRVHSVAVTSKGELWCWGCGRNGRLGLGSSFDELEPMLVEGVVEGVQAVCGFDHTLVLLGC